VTWENMLPTPGQTAAGSGQAPSAPARSQAQELDPDDPTSGYMLQAGARLCKCLGEEFLPYLGLVMPPLLAAAQLKPDVHITDAASDADEADDDEEARPGVRGRAESLKSACDAGSASSASAAAGTCRSPNTCALGCGCLAWPHGHLQRALAASAPAPQRPAASRRGGARGRWRRSTWATARSASARACWRRRRPRATCCAAMRTS